MSMDKYLVIIQDSIEHINQQLPSEQQISKEPDTVLVGPMSNLDSLSVINLIVEVEERIYATSGERIEILDKGIMSEEPGTISTIRDLIDWIIREI